MIPVPVTDCKDSQSLTRLGISAHHLEIEKGRHKNLAREDIFCAWCKLCLGQDVIENENHLLNECDHLQKLSSSLLLHLHFNPSLLRGHKLRGNCTFLLKISALYNNLFQTSQAISGYKRINILLTITL